MTDATRLESTTPARHETLWYDDGNVVLQAESTLFNVHRSILARASKLFEDMFTLGQPHDGKEGTSASPVPIHDVRAEAFGNLLLQLYLPWGSKLVTALSDEQFVDVLRLAHRLQFEEICTIVSDHLVSRLSAERRLQLGPTCGLDAWSFPAFEELVLQMTTHSQCGDTSIPPAPWHLVYRARLAISQYRSSTIRQRVIDLEHGRMHWHAAGPMLELIPHLSRAEFTEKLLGNTAPRQFLQGSGYLCCYGPLVTIEMLQDCYPEQCEEEEKRVIRTIWEECYVTPVV
ncbi:hypothetical protein EXIGLDRAFT_835377 [Exidia glandulosa HHB12029]|uniref:BTB domain-containing protein n=1 Tax=Exidia glandulosa HHB12029 TaxID=1314781 RepID=A0A165ITT8_EXIGL|nr:hypothetical protein EXIGLDRAFT_835377 [Exidia glandulosa HHB12029]